MLPVRIRDDPDSITKSGNEKRPEVMVGGMSFLSMLTFIFRLGMGAFIRHAGQRVTMKNLLSRYISLSLALRYLNPLRTYFSVITLICLLGVALGVMVLIVVLSVMGGLQKEIQGNLFAHSPHIQVGYKNELGMREVLYDWEDVSEKLNTVPGVQSSYALIEDYALVDVEGRQRPCFFRAIDTDNKDQLEDLNHLIVAGAAELDMGEKAVVSSLVAESMGLGVGSTIRVYTTRNFQEIAHAYQQTELPLLAEGHGKELKELEEWGRAWKTDTEGEWLSQADYEKAFELLNGLLQVSLRDADQKKLMDLTAYLQSAQAEGKERLRYVAGTKQEWDHTVRGLCEDKRSDSDVSYFRQIKELVMPKDLEVIGVYRASQHTPSPDLFIPLVIGQELLGYEDNVVQAVALRIDDPYHVDQMLPPLREALASLPAAECRTLNTWQDRFSSWFELMQKERLMMSFVLSFISLISAFCIMAVMFTVSIQRKREIAVMKALGATPFQVVRVFLWQGVIIGFLGGILGIALGLLVLKYRMEIQGTLVGMGFDPFPVNFHGTSEIPVVIDWWEMIWQGVKAFLMVTVASVIPALITARQDPARSLRSM